MTDEVKDMLLTDALKVAIESEKKLIKMRKAVRVLSMMCVVLVGVIIWIGH